MIIQRLFLKVVALVSVFLAPIAALAAPPPPNWVEPRFEGPGFVCSPGWSFERGDGEWIAYPWIGVAQADVTFARSGGDSFSAEWQLANEEQRRHPGVLVASTADVEVYRFSQTQLLLRLKEENSDQVVSFSEALREGETSFLTSFQREQSPRSDCLAPVRQDKRIAITFDDTPRQAGAFLDVEKRAAILIEELRKAGVEQAAFFINPGQLSHRAYGLNDITAYAEAGHVLANHTSRHSNLTEVTIEEFIADLDEAALFLELEEVQNTRPWFRFPYLNEGRRDAVKRDAIREALVERGLLNGYVTVDANDWLYERQTVIAAREGKEMDMEALRRLYVQVHVEAAEFNHELALRSVGYAPAHVLLLHETDLAAMFIGDLVEDLRVRGWTIITADEAYADPFSDYAATYDTPSAQGTLTEQVAWQAGIPAPRWYEGNNQQLAIQWFKTRVLGEAEDRKE